MSNPILATWTTPFALAPFDAISDDDLRRQANEWSMTRGGRSGSTGPGGYRV